jgi:serine/threonine protein kinase
MQVQGWKEIVAAGFMVLIPDSWTSLLISLLVCILTTLLVRKYVRSLVTARYHTKPQLTVDLLSLCSENVNSIENLVNVGNLLNKRQCQDLSNKLSRTIRSIQELVSHCGATLVLSRLALETLYRTLEKAKLLVQDCHNEDWCRASIYQIQNENSFREILLDMGLCYHAICEQVKGTIERCSMEPEDLCRSFLFQPASNSDIHQDQEELRERLEQIVNTSRWSGRYLGSLLGRVAQKHCLARYLLDKSKCLSQEFQSRDLVTSGKLLLAKDAELAGPHGGCDILGSAQDGTAVVRTEWFGVPAAKKVFLGEGFENFFLKEAAILAHLNHPRIVNFYCCGNDYWKGEGHFITMELLETSLSNLIEKQSKPFSLPVAIDIIVQIARGMCYLHDVGVAHRDLKPQNVVANRLTWQHLGDEYYCAKLVDFGMSKTKVEVSKYNSISARGVGTTRYRAPEVHPKAHPDSNGKAIWFKADVYSFAMTCYHILSLQPPYGNLKEYQMYEEQVVLGRRPEFPKYCPKVLVSLLKECWDPEPRSRPYFQEICIRLEEIRHDLLRGSVGSDQDLQELYIDHSTKYHIIEKLKEYSSIQSWSVGESDDINIEVLGLRTF